MSMWPNEAARLGAIINDDCREIAYPRPPQLWFLETKGLTILKFHHNGISDEIHPCAFLKKDFRWRDLSHRK